MPHRDRWAVDDVLAAESRPRHPSVEVSHGLTLTHTGSGITGTVVRFAAGDRVMLADSSGTTHVFRALDGAFAHNGVRVALRPPSAPRQAPRRVTASGSVAVAGERAKAARPSRIWVEGMHDAALIQKIWGEDLGSVGIAVEALHGVDDLIGAVADFSPNGQRRLGILLDHLVESSKESAIAARISDANVLIAGHPYVDIWEAVSPALIGRTAWPSVPHGRTWKDGVLDALDIESSAGEFWARLLDQVRDYRDVETPLVNAVERLIDFVTAA